jgi:hypothetical protein
MPHDPHAEFDHALLDMIEHSPIGAVPRTLTHQDSLKRLLATQQVYASADHKDGFVTARSLATTPLFYAENLDALIAGLITTDELEKNARIFDRYVQSLPETYRARAESKRLMVAGKPVHHRSKHDGATIHDPAHTLFLVPGAGTHPGLPGNYLYGFVHEMSASAWTVHLHDSDDGAAKFDAPNLAEALAKLQEVIASTPFHLSELEALGFAAI